ncbi:serine acetyltransferase [Blautia coccoides]|uniref:serine acetyltransferase n=1 Tax=Blautia producta TaxID=33035 RepID=UPI0028A33F3B|nr:serine acetyltransferase [Blautia coccoides]MDT4375368.1 serine acetyltransferase [Blautia coccoides]
MITSKEEYKYYLKCDCIANSFDYKKIHFPGFNYTIRFLKILRKCEYYKNCKSGIWYLPIKAILKIKLERARLKYGWFIPLNVCEEGLSLPHCGPIIINCNSKIGRNCRIHVGVNIGTKAGYGDKAPIIGNNVYIAPGAKLFGDIYIGDETAIGANAVVTKSFSDGNAVLLGIPAVKSSDLIKNTYIERIPEEYIKEKRV